MESPIHAHKAHHRLAQKHLTFDLNIVCCAPLQSQMLVSRIDALNNEDVNKCYLRNDEVSELVAVEFLHSLPRYNTARPIFGASYCTRNVAPQNRKKQGAFASAQGCSVLIACRRSSNTVQYKTRPALERVCVHDMQTSHGPQQGAVHHPIIGLGGCRGPRIVEEVTECFNVDLILASSTQAHQPGLSLQRRPA